jgi:hypothetical protein
LSYHQGKDKCEVAIKSYKPEEFATALYEILNSSRLYEKHRNLVDLRGVSYDLKNGSVVQIDLLFDLVKG